jgi:nitrate/nitrite-specific signal transduction histidine kinase
MQPDHAAIIADLEARLASVEAEAERHAREMDGLYAAGIALSAQADLDQLYHLILETARVLTRADAGTLYLVDREEGRRVLVFTATQHEGVRVPIERLAMPLDTRSIAGYVALTGTPLLIDDAYRLPSDVPYSFNRTVDEQTGFRTGSMLTVPMVTIDDRTIGVLQLLNPRRNDHDSAPFTAADERLALALASQAAVAVENRRLMETDRLYQLLQEYVREVNTVIVAAGDVEAGCFDPDSLVAVAERDDALGQLARTFSRMAQEVRAREERLRAEVQQLRIEIDHTRTSRQVAAITGTAYFQELKRTAHELREHDLDTAPQ